MSQETEKVQGPEIIEEEEILKAASGEPFATERAAKGALTQKGLNPSEWTIRPAMDGSDGFILVKRPKFREKYYRVKFAGMGSANDTIDVELSVNGEKLVIAREREVVIPERFKICADNTTYVKWVQDPNRNRKRSITIQKYPYSLMGEATEPEFIAQKKEGTDKTKAAIRKFGYDYAPEDVED